MARKRKSPFNLYRKQDDGPWYVDFLDIQGRRQRLSTGKTDPNEAQREAIQILASNHSSHQDGSAKATPKAVSLEECFNLYLTKQEPFWAHATLLCNQQGLGHVARVLGPSTSISEITMETMDDYFLARRKEGASPSTIVQTEISNAQAALRKMLKDKNIELIPKHLQKFKHVSRKRFLTQDEIDKLLAVIEEEDNMLGNQYRDYIVAYLATGLRRTELFSIKASDVDLDQRVFVAFEKKGGQVLAKAIMHDLFPIIKRRMVTHPDCLFPRVPNWHDKTKRWMAKAGIPGFTIHDLRRTLGSQMGQNGQNSFVIRDALGQKNIQVTSQHYAHLATESIRVAIERSIRLDGGKRAKKKAKKSKVSQGSKE